jgi:hypothetical protein
MLEMYIDGGGAASSLSSLPSSPLPSRPERNYLLINLPSSSPLLQSKAMRFFFIPSFNYDKLPWCGRAYVKKKEGRK